MPTPGSRCGVLLAGGTSSRFAGPPKGLAPFGGARLADVALSALHAVCDRVVIAANDAAAPSWFPDHEIVRDVVPARGALSALETAMLAAGDDTVVVCAWDMPFVTAALLDALAIAVERGAPACVPRHATGLHEPLCAAYAPSCAALASALLLAGERAAYALVDACAAEPWPISQTDTEFFFSVNTVHDLTYAINVPRHTPWVPA